MAYDGQSRNADSPYRAYRPADTSPVVKLSRLDPGRSEYLSTPEASLYRDLPESPSSRKPLPSPSTSYFGAASYSAEPETHYAGENKPLPPGPDYGAEPSLRSNDSYYDSRSTTRMGQQRQYSDEIPLTEHPQRFAGEAKPLAANDTPSSGSPDRSLETEEERQRRRRRRREQKPKKFWSWSTPWMVYIFSLIQVIVFIAELVRNSVLTSSPIEIHPQINPMLGPSFAVLINMGARYVPCMKNVTGVPLDTKWPCPNTTSNDPNDPSNQCNIAELCGFEDFGMNPNQWFRFITPIFIHAGIVHIGFNLLLQLTLGREIERTIGPIRFVIVYISSGIFGFVLGGNFAASGIASMGASGALFGIIAINLLDLLYTWNERVSPKKELAFIILDIVVSFALGLLPGLDNFSHIGGFLMGLVLGICILHSPNLLRRDKVVPSTEPSSEQPLKKPRSRRAKRVSYKSFAKDPTGFFRGRKALWWVWWLVRAGALLGVLIAFVVLINNFYKYHDTCLWCKYLSCINVNNWCDMGNLTAQLAQQNQSHLGGGQTNARLLLRGPGPVDLSAFL